MSDPVIPFRIHSHDSYLERGEKEGFLKKPILFYIWAHGFFLGVLVKTTSREQTGEMCFLN